MTTELKTPVPAPRAVTAARRNVLEALRTRRRAIAAAACMAVALSSFHAHAGFGDDAKKGLEKEVSGFIKGLSQLPSDVVDEVASDVVLNEPGAFFGQSWNTYSAGSAHMRVPVRSLGPLVQVDYPSISAGCGGIDAHFGSISHLSGGKLLEFLKAVAVAMPGVAIQIALGAISPHLASKLEWAKNLVDKINGFNKNSCETARSIIDGGASMFTESNHSRCVQQKMIKDGMNIEEARSRCVSVSDINDVNKDAKEKGEDLPIFEGNLVWEALKKVPDSTLSREERELVMSLVGTYVYCPATSDPRGADAQACRPSVDDGKTPGLPDVFDEGPDKGEDEDKGDIRKDDRGQIVAHHLPPRYLGPAVLTLRDMLKGNDEILAPAGGGEKVRLYVYKCPSAGEDPSDRCLAPRMEATEMPSVPGEVKKQVRALVNKVMNREGLKKSDIALINAASFPLWQAVRVGTMSPGGVMAHEMVNKYSEVIAADVIYGVFKRNIQTGQEALRVGFNLNTEQQRHLEKISDNGTKALQMIMAEKQAADRRVADPSNVIAELEKAEGAMLKGLPSSVMALLAQKRAVPTR
ncbi:MAG: conjugal transfer protein TraH [Burkholderiaceae bacterium]|nr:conjugal transfer protein TraH [Aquabacterium sp.]NUP85824.1 conjugal transfer protein TraH [Burkholderiaceae bacterium]